MLVSMSTERKELSGNICGFKIRELRKKLGIAQVDFAAALNVDYGFTFDQSDISEIERKFRGVKDYELKAIAQLLEVSCDELLR